MDALAVTVRNDSSQDLFIDGDPNWDDQVLTIDGKPAESIYQLNPGASAVVGIPAGYNEMGVIFAGTRNYDYDGGWFYQLTIGPDPETGNQSVTDDNTMGTPEAKYALQDQKPLSMTMIFTDVGGG